MSLHALYLCVNQFIWCLHSEWKQCSWYTPPSTVVFLIFLGFEALLFAIFTMVMLATQLQAICSDETVCLLLYFQIFTNIIVFCGYVIDFIIEFILLVDQ